MALILNLWQVMFEPILTSGLGVWGHDTKARKSIARATRAFLMRACRLDHSPPAGLLEVELGILSADGAWMKTLLTELHRLHMRRMGNALEPIHQANLAAESWAADGSWEGHGGAPPVLLDLAPSGRSRVGPWQRRRWCQSWHNMPAGWITMTGAQ